MGGGLDLFAAERPETSPELKVMEEFVRDVHLVEVAGEHVEALIRVNRSG